MRFVLDNYLLHQYLNTVSTHPVSPSLVVVWLRATEVQATVVITISLVAEKSRLSHVTLQNKYMSLWVCAFVSSW
jgi:hypothetical protein